ncbi:MAG TPA: HEAT repeat domain-containing protein [Candidatus Acidoferrum sp.]|nr:HEAT repeat domain-containing protein [Candidatus Acidoferrum sp.]
MASRRRSKSSFRLLRSIPFFLFLAAASILAGFAVGRLNISWTHWPNYSSAHATSSLPTAPAFLSTSDPQPKNADMEEIGHLAPQQQAEHLLELAVNLPEPSLDLIHKNLDSWRGHLENTDRLFHLVLAALKADDPRVRTAAVEIDLAANHLEKSPQSLARLIHQIHSGTDSRFLALWRLGALGNRGVEPAAVLSTLLLYSRDANQQTRFWAVEGLAMLGTEESIDPLLSVLAHDPSAKVREGAACGLARTGLLTGQQRLAAVPQLLNLLDDDSLDSSTQDMVYSVLQSVTGASLGKDPNAWRAWWAHHDHPEKPHHHLPKGLLTA